MPKIDFSHKVVLLAGASDSIGAEIARRLSEQGSRLVITGRSMGDLQNLIRELSDQAKLFGSRIHRAQELGISRR
jgi:NADP-dependent 3-hydroxy acid dehydrogenase YdfG